jgi:pimeloyl-ACP methyl ester carboxylesterase
MADAEMTSLSISGYAGKPVPNRFWRQRTVLARAVGILLPGLTYSCDMPLLFYPARLLLQLGADVLQINSDYTVPAFRNASRPEQANWLGSDADAAVQSGLAQRDYSHLVLIGKSIGTLALAHLLSLDFDTKTGAANTGAIISPANTLWVWMTPLLRQPWLVEAALRLKSPALFIAGTGDSTYDAREMERIRAATGADLMQVIGADHSLEIPGDIHKSLLILHEVVQRIDQFLTGNGVVSLSR